jgi:hypothetical protein
MSRLAHTDLSHFEPLHLAMANELLDIVYRGDLEQLRVYLDQRAHAWPDALAYAVKCRSRRTRERVVQWWAANKPDAVHPHQRTMEHAARHGDIETLQLIAPPGTTVHAHVTSSTLWHAAMSGHRATLEFLYERHVCHDVAKCDENAVSSASHPSSIECFKYLAHTGRVRDWNSALERVAGVTAGSTTLLAFILDTAPTGAITLSGYQSAFQNAARYNGVACVQFLLTKCGTPGVGALHAAVWSGYVNIAWLLVKSGSYTIADLSLALSIGEPHMHWHSPVHQLLIKEGARDWSESVIEWLRCSPDVVVRLFRSGRVDRQLFIDAGLNAPIVAFIAEQDRIRERLYEDYRLPRVLCGIVTVYI